MWTSRTDQLDAGRVLKVSVQREAHPLSYADVLGLWQQDESFRSFYIGLLAATPFTAYFWETPPVTKLTVDQPFEFVLVDSPGLGRVSPDTSAFADHFNARCKNEKILTFPNLGKDALLVVPCPGEPQSAYSHLAAFIRGAPEARKQALWQRVGRVTEQYIHGRPTWLSTSGLGVYWLHVRLDSWPKYYSFRPYREAAQAGRKR
jgi:hypothetical protein